MAGSVTLLSLLCLILGVCEGFLLCSLTSMFPMFCSLNCHNGYAKDSSGCTICKCATASSDSTAVSEASAHANPASTSGYHHPCLPHQQFCPLNCPEGYLTGTGGCQFCICYQSNVTDPITTSPPPTTHGVKVHMTNPCIQNQTVCDKFCGEGYLLGPDGCQYCLCRNLIPGLVYTKDFKKKFIRKKNIQTTDVERLETADRRPVLATIDNLTGPLTSNISTISTLLEGPVSLSTSENSNIIY